MPQRLAEIRVRPQSAVVLIDRNASEDEFILGIRLCSKLWGGMHFKIIIVDGNDPNEIACKRLMELRPEFVYGVRVDAPFWNQKLYEICQPRGFGILTEEFVNKIQEALFEKFYVVHHVLHQIFRERQNKNADGYCKIMSVDTSSGMRLSMFIAAFFGSQAINFEPPLVDGIQRFEEDSFDAFLDLIIQFQDEQWISTLELTRYKLRLVSSLRHLPPTIVLVQSWHDMALYWNMQSMEGHNHPGWIVPIPASEKLSPSTVMKLAKWVDRIGNDDLKSNYWQITSSTANDESCQIFAQSLQEHLKDSEVTIVEHFNQSEEGQLTIPYEYKSRMPIDVKGRKLVLQLPHSRAFDSLVNQGAVMVDLLSDVSSGRAIMEMQLPPTQVLFELLNCPSPPSYTKSYFKAVGDGPESVSVRCTEPEAIIELYCPTAFEIIGETMRFSGFEGLHDEKRSLYGPVIRLFGGLDQAASDMSSTCGQVLRFLCENPRSVSAIKQHIRIGGADIEPMPYLTRVANTLQWESELVKRVSLNRFKRFARGQRPSEKKLEEILEYWVERGVLRRTMKIGPCKHCRREFFADRISLLESVSCHYCGKTTPIRAEIALSYALDPRIDLALREGLIPVAQAARFLSNLTTKGFMYLPGFKYKTNNNIFGDVDLIAVCDGHLIFCECKDLQDSALELMSGCDIMNQFRNTVEVAIKNKASTAIFASRLIRYSDALQSECEKEFDGRIAIRFLAQSDLDNGFRQTGDVFTRMRLEEIVSAPKDRVSTIQNRPGRRIIRSKWFVQSDGDDAANVLTNGI